MLRPATKQDAAQLAVPMDIASRGLVSWAWTAHASAGRLPLEVGRVRINDQEGTSFLIVAGKLTLTGEL